VEPREPAFLTVSLDPNPAIEAYKKDVDRTLLRCARRHRRRDRAADTSPVERARRVSESKPESSSDPRAGQDDQAGRTSRCWIEIQEIASREWRAPGRWWSRQALERLEAVDPDLARLVELRFYAGLTVEETAEVLGVSPRTIKRDWRKARAFLFDAIGGSRGDDARQQAE
jgi:RNA polymerase sigma factor (sigma-70 family)